MQIFLHGLTCEVSPLVNILKGVAVLEAQFLVKIVASSGLSARKILFESVNTFQLHVREHQLTAGNCQFSLSQHKILREEAFLTKDTYDFLCDWLMVIGLVGEEGVMGPKAELFDMSSACSMLSPAISPSSSTMPSTQPPKYTK